MKSFGSTEELPFKLLGLSVREESGTLGVRVKSVEIERNTSSEGGFLDYN